MSNRVKELYEEKYVLTRELQQFENYERNVRFAELFDKIIGFNTGTALDLACGDGVVAEWLNDKGFLTTAIDISEQAVELARKRKIGQVVMLDVEAPLPFKDKRFDLIFWGDSVEHLFDPLKLLKEIKRILKDEGVLVITTPNMGCLSHRIRYLIQGRIHCTENYSVADQPWEWAHIRFFNKNTIRRFLATGGLTMNSFHTCHRRPLLRNLCKLFSPLGSIMIVTAKKGSY